jgi:hypothetical protein
MDNSQSILDLIVERVAKYGVYEVSLATLLNGVFCNETSPEARLNLWAQEQDLCYEIVTVHLHGEKKDIAVFSKSR